MSAIRTPGGLLDPTTRQPYVPEAPRSVVVYPVTRRPATPEELARFAQPVDPEPRVSPIHTPRRNPANPTPLAERRACPHVPDADVVLAMASGSIAEASEALGVNYSTLYRRVAQMRAGGRL